MHLYSILLNWAGPCGRISYGCPHEETVYAQPVADPDGVHGVRSNPLPAPVS